MKDIRIYQSNKYRCDRYRIAHYIYYYDKVKNTNILPLAGTLTQMEDTDADKIISLLCIKHNLVCSYKEIIQIANKIYILFELSGQLNDLMNISDIIGKNIDIVYANKFIDLTVY